MKTLSTPIPFHVFDNHSPAFSLLGKLCPEFLTDESATEKLRLFRIRLQYFARGLNVYIKQLKIALQEKQVSVETFVSEFHE